VLALIGVLGLAFTLGRRTSAGAPPVYVTEGPVRPSTLYASDGRTLIARFDRADPRENCLSLKSHDWGFYCDYLVSWWSQQAGLGPLRTGSLDVKLQAVAAPRVGAVTGPWVFSLVAVQPGSGLIRTMATNRAPSPSTSLGEQTYEPFLLAAAFERHIPLSYTVDTQRRYTSSYQVPAGGPDVCVQTWCPFNRDGSSGKRDMWQALAGDVTTYFVPLEERVGVTKVIEMAQRLGIQVRSSSGDDQNWGSFIFGTDETTALELATAYATLAADGRHCDPRPVQSITDPAGRTESAVGSVCSAAVSADVARATMDAARCPVGDRPASGNRCGDRKGPASGVRAAVGRPVAGVFGIDANGTGPALAVAGPQLVTAALIGNGPVLTGKTRARLIDAVTGVESRGLKPLPVKGFTAPSRKLTGTPGQQWW
jgi:hypothetical protein